MDGRKFIDVIHSFCKEKEFSPEDSTNFELYIIETFQIIKNLMESREYDFIAVRKLGTFFLKVWTVHSRMKELEKKLFAPYEESRKSNSQYRDEKKKYDELQIIYKRMTDDFFDRKLYFAERKQERKEKRLNQQLMMDIAIEDIENNQIDTMKLLETLKLAWENKGEIAEGFYNTYLSLDKEMKEEAERRKVFCESNTCGHYDKEGKPETSAIPGEPACNICHCNINMLVHTMSKNCSLDKIEQEPLWEAVTTDEQELHVGQKIYENQFKKK